MTHGRKLSDEQLEEMAELREKGWSSTRIQRHFERQGTTVSRGAIDWQCLRIGADRPPERRRPSSERQQPYSRNGHIVRPFTAAEDRELLELERQGLKTHQIARKLRRGNNSVIGRLMTLARRDARAEEMAS